MAEFTDKYFDVLQNIEFAIMSAAREAPDATDWDVEQALDVLIREYRSRRPAGEPAERRLSPVARDMAGRVRAILEWRNTTTAEPPPRRVTPDEIVACLKRIQKSVRYWTKKGGRTGYLDFVDQFVK
jgi:hypothetical protein